MNDIHVLYRKERKTDNTTEKSEDYGRVIKVAFDFYIVVVVN